MSKESQFLIFCIEMYKQAKNLSGKEVITLFNRYRVSEYIISCYEALHTTGTQYIVEDIDRYISVRSASE